MTLSGPTTPAAAGPATHLVVLVHGYGADGNDLIDLASHWQPVLPGEFVAAPQLTYERSQAWWISFQRKDEIWIAISVGLAAAFIGFALSIGRRAGGGVATGAAMGGGVLALSAICVSCLAPVLSVVGLGLAGSLLAGLPKWLIALNTLMLTGWGALYLTRRGSSCPIPRSDVPISSNPKAV